MWTAFARDQYRRTGCRYVTDVTDAEFALIEPLLPVARRGGRRRETSLREVLNALLYLRTGCPWRMLPREFPPRSTVYGYFRRFWRDGIWSTIQATLLMAARERAGRAASPAAGIIDSQSVKTTKAGGPRGFDAGKKVNRRKPDVPVDTLAFLLRGIVHAADIQDRYGLEALLAHIRRRFPFLARPFADGSYQGEIAASAARQEERVELAIIKCSDRAPGFVVLARRWVVERSFAL